MFTSRAFFQAEDTLCVFERICSRFDLFGFDSCFFQLVESRVSHVRDGDQARDGAGGGRGGAEWPGFVGLVLIVFYSFFSLSKALFYFTTDWARLVHGITLQGFFVKKFIVSKIP